MSLHDALHELQLRYRGISPWPGFVRAVLSFLVTYLFVGYCLLAPLDWVWFVMVLAGGFSAASLLVLTHDGLHFTLTGWRRFDNFFSRLVSYPILWPHETYGELHRLHHKLNGNNPLDPENVMMTREEWNQASRSLRFYRRHQWFINLFLSGGFGMIAHHWMTAFRLRPSRLNLRKAMRTDFWGMVVWHATVITLLVYTGLFWRWLALFLIMERIVGFVHQLRSQVEHYSAWNPRGDPLETQVFSARNTQTSWFVSQFLNGLNFHSVHHAFPTIPFYKLKAVHEALNNVCERYNAPLLFGRGYLRTAWKQSRKLKLIEA